MLEGKRNCRSDNARRRKISFIEITEVFHGEVRKISMILSYNGVIVFVDGNPIAANVAGSALLCSAKYIYRESLESSTSLYSAGDFPFTFAFSPIGRPRSTGLISITSTIEAYSIAARALFPEPTEIRFTEYSLETRSLSDLDFCPPASDQKATLNGPPPRHLSPVSPSIVYSRPVACEFPLSSRPAERFPKISERKREPSTSRGRP